MTARPAPKRAPAAKRNGGAQLKLMPRASARPSQPATASSPSAGGPGLLWAVEPAALHGEGLAEWRRLAVVFAGDPARFTEADRAGLIAYCTFWGDFTAAAADVRERGVTVEGRSSADRGRQVRNPSLAAGREASQQLRLWAVQLQLTPAARRSEDRIAPADAANPFA